MATKKKLLQAAAGAAGGEALNVEDVFSTYLYTGNNTTNTINNGIDLDGEGGLVWIKRRSNVASHALVDTERGDDKYLKSDSTSSQSTRATMLSFSSTGFSLDDGFSITNGSGGDFASWTFRKAPKFFDVVTYTGDGVSGREIAHNLGTTPGCIIVKTTNVATNWAVYHRGVDATNPEQYGMWLDLTNARASDSTRWNNTAPSSTVFTVGNAYTTNYSGNEYVAYLFAHNDGDGEFGPDGDADIIKCGSYTGTGTAGHFIDLGFEPQWLMIKRSDAAGSWEMLDIMRGMPAGGEGSYLRANSSNAEATSSNHSVTPSPTGFTIESTSNINGSGDSFIYIAIRRGPMAVPEDATEVFEQAFATSPGNPNFVSGFPVDAALRVFTDGSSVYPQMSSRLTQGKYLKTSSTAAEVSFSNWTFDYQDGVIDGTSASSLLLTYMWKRAPNFFDVVCFEGTGATAQTINHNLGVVPEMMWLKRRDNAQAWQVYHSGLNSGTDPEDYYLILNASSDEANSNLRWNDTAPTETQFTVNGAIASNGADFVMYLFASLGGISKVSWYTGTGADGNNIDCGFSSGARFVLIKRVDQNENWILYDTERGIVAGNDPYLLLNSTSAETTGTDYIDPYSSGFAVNNNALVNASGGRYVFYAIA